MYKTRRILLGRTCLLELELSPLHALIKDFTSEPKYLPIYQYMSDTWLKSPIRVCLRIVGDRTERNQTLFCPIMVCNSPEELEKGEALD